MVAVDANAREKTRPKQGRQRGQKRQRGQPVNEEEYIENNIYYKKELKDNSCYIIVKQVSSEAECWTHNPKVTGSKPVPANILVPYSNFLN